MTFEPQRTLVILAGLPGSGKTYLHTHDEDLSRLRAVEMADYLAQFPGIHPDQALSMAFDALEVYFEELERSGVLYPRVILESHFLPDSQGAKTLLEVCEQMGWQTEITVLEASKEVMVQNIKSSGKQVEMRLWLLERYLKETWT